MAGDTNEVRSTIASTTGGVMCRGIGAVTGELEVSTRRVPEGLEVAVRYAGAGEWYLVEGSPVPLDEDEDRSSEDLRELVEKRLTTPGEVVDGNEQPVSLVGF
ncbi:hypothetical protein BH23ACT11_BH23ACT11_11370 [soil metagenome]